MDVKKNSLCWIRDVFWLGRLAPKGTGIRCWDPIAKHISNPDLAPFCHTLKNKGGWAMLHVGVGVGAGCSNQLIN